MDLNLENWRAWRHMQDLIRYRNSGKVLDAGMDWLDKEISDIKAFLEGKTADKKANSRIRPRKIAGITNIFRINYITIE